MSISRNSYVPLYIQVKEEIKKNITSGIYKMGDTIPSEKELMELFDVGRATIREAITQLVIEGFLEKRQGVGTFVKQQSKAIGFEPFISLEYTLKSYGLMTKNEILDQKLIDNTEAIRCYSKLEMPRLFRLSRLRSVASENVVLEEFLFDEKFYERTKDFDFEQSIGALILQQLQLDVTKFVQEVVIESADSETQKLLTLKDKEQVLIMKRWLYVGQSEAPYQYYKMIVPLRLTTYPFK